MPNLQEPDPKPRSVTGALLLEPGYGSFVEPTDHDGTAAQAIKRLYDLMVTKPEQGGINSGANLPAIIPFLSRFILHDMSAHLTDKETSAAWRGTTPQPPRINLQSVYGTRDQNRPDQSTEWTPQTGFCDPHDPEKVQLGTLTKFDPPNATSTQDNHRDLPQKMDAITLAQKAASERSGQTAFSLKNAPLETGLRARKDIVLRQIHLSVRRFHNAAIDFLRCNPKPGFVADYATAQRLTIWHFQNLVQSEFLTAICRDDIVNAILQDHASTYAKHLAVESVPRLPIEFVCIIHALVQSTSRHAYEYNSKQQHVSSDAFSQTVFDTGSALSPDWIIEWQNFLQAKSATQPGVPDRKSYPINTFLTSHFTFATETPAPSGQALHAFLSKHRQVLTKPQKHVSDWLIQNAALKSRVLQGPPSLNTATPLGLYALAEAENEQGDSLGPVGSWVIATTILGCLFDEPNSALRTKFQPDLSPLRTDTEAPITTFSDWFAFAG